MCGILYVYPANLAITDYAKNIINRGPDGFIFNEHAVYHRLAIQNKNSGVNFITNEKYTLLCNGEIYQSEFARLETDQSDCDVILRIYESYGVEKLMEVIKNSEFAFIIVNNETKKVEYVARDRFGIRPLFRIEYNDPNTNVKYEIYCSEIKYINPLLLPDCTIEQFKPYAYKEESYMDNETKEFEMIQKLHEALRASVYDRVNMCDVPVGFLLSGGMDSSIICAIANRIMKNIKGKDFKIRTFAIGLDDKATDILAAREVAKFIDSDHTEIIMSPEDFINAIDETIYFEETYDITTIRAGIPMNLIAKWIRKNTDIKVVITGEGSDELFGSYRYFLNAPSPRAHVIETFRLLGDIHYFDVLRCDRTISNNGLEARVPFLDSRVVDTVHSLFSPNDYVVKNGLLKYILRKIAEVLDYLPKSIYYRPKEALSDGVSTEQVSWFEILKNYFADVKHTTEKTYYYHKYADYYGTKYKAIPYYWLPKWCGDESDPSARKLDVIEKHSSIILASRIEYDDMCYQTYPCIHYNVKVYINNELVEEFGRLDGEQIYCLFKKHDIPVDTHFNYCKKYNV